MGASPHAVSDRELFEAYRHGNPDAFEALFSRHRDSIRGAAFKVLRDRSAAEDIAQETFIRLSHVGSGPHDLPAYLSRVAVNLSLNEKRRRTRRPVEAALDEASKAPAERLEEQDPQAVIATRRQDDQMRSLWETSDAKHRRVLGLRHLHGMSYAEVANEMGLSVKAVEALLARARRQFRARYEDAASITNKGAA
jgi:RNA polymerase sigma-70 factor (ECF subfamily)